MTPALSEALRHLTTGTITTMLLKKGIRRCWMKGPMPLQKGERGLYPMNDETRARYEAWKKQG
jgi:hypothetical protein